MKNVPSPPPLLGIDTRRGLVGWLAIRQEMLRLGVARLLCHAIVPTRRFCYGALLLIEQLNALRQRRWMSGRVPASIAGCVGSAIELTEQLVFNVCTEINETRRGFI